MSWIVGLDLRNPHAGTEQFARWLRAQGNTSSIRGLHVIDTNEAPASPELIARAERAVREHVERAGAGDVFSIFDVATGSTVEDALIASCAKNEGVIVGRRVGIDEQRMVRLGSVTRQLLRRLPAPLIVVPPDLDAVSLGNGPVLVALTQAWDGVWATHRLGAQLAAGIGRDLVIVHVAPPSKSWDTPYLPPDQQAQQRGRQKVRAERELETWMAERGNPAERSVVLQGKALEGILQAAAELESPLIVCGRPKETVLQRFFGGTTATDVAAYSRVPVAVACTS